MSISVTRPGRTQPGGVFQKLFALFSQLFRDFGRQGISGDAALRIAHRDAEGVYRDLANYRIILALEPDGWHVDYELKSATAVGGGPHYVIDAVTGGILSKRYEQ